LEAWHNGQQPDVLKRQDPPIYFTDFAWEKGARLEKYDIGGEMERSGQSVIASVVLTLGNRGAPKSVRYRIDTSPAAIVIVPEI